MKRGPLGLIGNTAAEHGWMLINGGSSGIEDCVLALDNISLLGDTRKSEAVWGKVRRLDRHRYGRK